MQDTDGPSRSKTTENSVSISDEASMRLALERLGTSSNPAPRATGNRPSKTVGNAHTAARPRPKFIRDGDVPVVHIASTPRSLGDAGRELAEERALRLRAEEALSDAQGTISRLQVARTRAEQALLAAQAAVEERELAMANLRVELGRATQREAVLVEAARVAAEAAKVAALLEAAEPDEPEPFRWWLEYLKRPRP